MDNKEEETSCAEGNFHSKISTYPTTLKFFYFVALLVFCKFSYRTYRNGLNQVFQSWGPLGLSKNSSRISPIPFVGNLHFSMFAHRMRYLQNLFLSRSHHFPCWVENPKLRTRVHKHPFSSACEKYVLKKTKIWCQTVEVEWICI